MPVMTLDAAIRTPVGVCTIEKNIHKINAPWCFESCEQKLVPWYWDMYIPLDSITYTNDGPLNNPLCSLYCIYVFCHVTSRTIRSAVMWQTLTIIATVWALIISNITNICHTWPHTTESVQFEWPLDSSLVVRKRVGWPNSCCLWNRCLKICAIERTC